MDPELQLNTKSELVYYINFPDNYNPLAEYPLIVSIDGYGGHPESEYQSKKLRPYLSKKYESIVVGVAYHGINRTGNSVEFSPEMWESIFDLKPGEFSNRFIKKNPMVKILDEIFAFLVERKISRLSSLLAIKSSLPDKYSSFGFLPAIEHLSVIHDVLSNFKIKLSEISILGTSYGGYIALLIGKFAPHTFNFIIDNSGFIATQFSEIHPSLVSSSSSYMRMINGKRYEIPVSTKSIWENNEFSKNYFSDAHRMIRNVALKEHMAQSDTKYFSYHSQEDTIALIAEKQLFCERLKEYAYVDFTKISRSDIDGLIFKNLNHGMNASLRKLYDITFKKNGLLDNKHNSQTDFHLNSKHIFNCFSNKYEFTYSMDRGLKVEIISNEISPSLFKDKSCLDNQNIPLNIDIQDTMTNQNTNSPTTITLTHLPRSYNNDVFNQNLAYFKANHPSLYNIVIKHKCEEYWLCSNPDGSPNIFEIKSNAPLYMIFNKESFFEIINKNISSLSANSIIPEAFVGGGDKRWKINSPIQCQMLNDLFVNGIFTKLGISYNNLEPLKKVKTDFIPLVRVYGIGLGYHITELIRAKKICYMTIYEPHIDLFYISLFTIPWNLIYKYFDAKGKGINLVIGGTPDNAIRNNMTFITNRLMPLTSFFYRFNHLNSVQSKELIKKEPQSDSIERSQSDAGWYEDQRSGFYLSARNIKKKNNFYTGQRAKTPFRAFIVGSGPSLNDSISYIEKHQNDALIFSCGSAITPLLKAGIIPDYEIVQERTWHFPKHEEKHDLALVKQISLLKLNVVSPKIDKYYKETLVFQKFRDPGSSFLGEEYAVTTAVNPTVTNAGIAICAALGAKEVYLFGVDYGAPLASKKMHAANTLHDHSAVDDSVDAKSTSDIPGNFGSTIRTTAVLSWSLQTTEMKIAEYPKIRWYNVGEGALISGAIPTKVENLPKKYSKKIAKRDLRTQIANCFNNNYSPDGIIKRLRTVQMNQVEEYFQSLLVFTTATPQTREEIIHVLRNLYEAVNVGKNQTNFLPSSLLPYGFMQFITSVYIQCSIEPNDDTAAKFFETSKNILTDYINNIQTDIQKILDYIECDEETELIQTW
jgi:hypothetical protein